MKMEQLASVQLAASFPEARQPPVAPQRTGRPPLHHLPSQMHKSIGMLQNLCSKRSPVQGRSTKGGSRHRLRMKTTLAMWKRTTNRTLRMLTAMTEIVASIMKIAEDGRRTHIAIRLVMGGETIRRSHLGEEELVKETEEDHRRHRPEEMEINLVVNLDRRVSLIH